MGKIIEHVISDFTKGIESDPRASGFQMIKHFDMHSNPRRLIPFRSWEDGDSSASTSKKQAFALALRTGTTYSLYALGISDTKLEVLYKDLTTGSANDLDDATWAAPSANQSGAGTSLAYDNFFVYYPKTNKIYFATGGSAVGYFSPSGAAWTASDQGITFVEINQGLVHSKDDILYVPYDNKIAKNNNGAWTVAALTLPSQFVVRSLAEYGDYLAIGCAPVSGIGTSRVFLWDRDSTLATMSESINWGQGSLQILEEVDGYLVGISYIGGTTISLDGAKVVIRAYAGGIPQVIKEIVSSSAGGALSTYLPPKKQKVNKDLYFMMFVHLGGTFVPGIWKLGRVGGAFALTLDREIVNDSGTDLTTSDTLFNFIFVGDYCFVSYLVSSGAVYTVSKTDDQENYTVSSTLETNKLGSAQKEYQLKSVGVMTEAMPTAGQIILKYRKNEESSWTTIFTNTTDNDVWHEAVNIESDGSALPRFREIQFQVLSTGKAVVTGLRCVYEELNSNLLNT